MPRTRTILRVFVASPGDVAEERELLESIIEELNLTWSKHLGIYLELVKYETHSYPGVGSDPQAIINEQIADDYDIFVGIMWARFGTPTGRAGSGTAEEFSRAWNRYQRDRNQIRIMFYFKETPISPSLLDPKQLASIQEFQGELGDKGTLYWTYSSQDEFCKLLRIHLNRQIQDFGKTWGLESKTSTIKEFGEIFIDSTEEEHDLYDSEDEYEEGYLDLLETGQEKMTTIQEGMSRMTTALQNLGEKLNERTEELKQAKLSEGLVEVRQAKRISNRTAEAMNDFAALMEAEVPVFANSYSRAIDAYTRAFTLSKEMGTEDRKDIQFAKDAIQQFKATVLGTQSEMLSFRQIIDGLPRATTMLNRAKRRIVDILDKFNEEQATVLNLTSEIEKLIDQMLEY
jgi:Domain of unknown function (DUF4062)